MLIIEHMEYVEMAGETCVSKFYPTSIIIINFYNRSLKKAIRY